MGFKEGFKKACATVKDAACGFADTVKQEYKKGQLKNELSELYETLGQVRYGELLDGGQSSEESLKLCEEIARVKAEIEAFQAHEDDVNEVNLCKKCGKKLPDDISYCPYCGEKTNEEE